MELFISKRPSYNERKFTSNIIDEIVDDICGKLPNGELSWLFNNCYPNTLDTTVQYSEEEGRPDTFVITGDINAMWLRDSTAQVWPYLKFCSKEEKLKNFIRGVINRQVKCILTDPYANAFNYSNEGSHWECDLTEMKPELHERKWEIDSLCYPVRLAYGYWKETGDTSCFDEKWLDAVKTIYKTLREQQRKENSGPYKFQRITAVLTDTVAGSGYGNPINPVGLIVSIFRPSDDSTILPFLIPSNMFAVVILKNLAEMILSIYGDAAFSQELQHFAEEVDGAIKKYAVIEHKEFGKIYAYEVDGFGNSYCMDDANIPSLLSLPYLGYCTQDDPVYLNTRNFVLSESNPYFFKGKCGEGIGGPHVGMNMIWPMSITMRALTSSNDEEILTCLKTLIGCHGGTGFMHEAFHKDDASDYTRSWFAWANTLFGELILKLWDENPDLRKNL